MVRRQTQVIEGQNRAVDRRASVVTADGQPSKRVRTTLGFHGTSIVVAVVVCHLLAAFDQHRFDFTVIMQTNPPNCMSAILMCTQNTAQQTTKSVGCFNGCVALSSRKLVPVCGEAP